MNHFWTDTLTLILVLDPFGNIPIFLALLKDVDPKRRRRVLLRESLIALAILAAFLLAGPWVLRLIGVEEPALTLAGGVVVFIIAMRMIFPHPGGMFPEETLEGEPLVVPIAVPLLAGPSACATVILLGTRHDTVPYLGIPILLAAWLATLIVTLLATRFDQWLGKRGLIALERLMGMLLIVIAVQMLVTGATPLLHGK
ncbi:MAG: MarC family protein [Phycisphaeraceae bacterium]|nr:MarC family protein [Phycisphaeraceae bacterium]